MYYEDENDKGFWDDEPTRPLERMSHRLKPAGNPPPRPHTTPHAWARRCAAMPARPCAGSARLPPEDAPPHSSLSLRQVG